MIVATCHCGRVRIVTPGPPPFRNQCSCSVCYKYGALWSYYPAKQITIEIQGQGVSAADPAAQSTTPLPGMQNYVRDVDGRPGNLAFNRCAHCGCMTHWSCHARGNVDENRVGVNTTLMEEADLEGVEVRKSTGPL